MGGRWNFPGVPVIYAAGSLALAMLERLVQRRDLAGTLLVAAEAPDDLAVEYLTDPPPGWRELGSPEAAALGTAWLRSARTALLGVPSAVVPRENNFLVNPAHADAGPHRGGRARGVGVGRTAVRHSGTVLNRLVSENYATQTRRLDR